MTQEIISGLHSCKPGHEPVIGQVKTFTVEQKVGKSGKPYLKIKAADAEHGGTPYRILEATPTGFTDSYGNISFNIGIEPAVKSGEVYKSSNVPVNEQPTMPPQRQAERQYNPLDERQRAIIRQHSQSMALELLKLKVTLNELTAEDLTPTKLTSLANFFDADVIGAATNE